MSFRVQSTWCLYHTAFVEIVFASSCYSPVCLKFVSLCPKRMQTFCLPLFNKIKPICAMWPQLKVHLEQFLSFSSFKERDDLLAFLSVMKEILFAQFLENIRLKLKKWKQITTFSNCCSKGGKHPHKLQFVCVANAYFCPFFWQFARDYI